MTFAAIFGSKPFKVAMKDRENTIASLQKNIRDLQAELKNSELERSYIQDTYNSLHDKYMHLCDQLANYQLVLGD